MKNRIKLLSLLLALTIFATACSNGKKESQDETSKESASESVTEVQETSEEAKDLTAKERTETHGDGLENKADTELDKFLVSMADNKDNKSFQMKVESEEKALVDGQDDSLTSTTMIKYDGENISNDTVSSDGMKVKIFSQVKDGKIVTYSAMEENGEYNYFKEEGAFEGENIGLNSENIFGNLDMEWKIKSSNGNVDIYHDTLVDKEIEALNINPMSRFVDPKGRVDFEVEFDKEKKELVKITKLADFKATLVYDAVGESEGAEKTSQIIMRGKTLYSDFKFSGVDKVVIPEEALKAETIQ